MESSGDPGRSPRLLFELSERAGETVVLQLQTKRTIDVARKLSGSHGFVSFLLRSEAAQELNGSSRLTPAGSKSRLLRVTRVRP